MADPDWQFLRELSAAPSRRSADDRSAQELMRLADDPLELNVFLRRGATPPAPRPDMVRVHAATLATAAVSKNAPSEARIYARIEAPAGDPAAPEAFVPSMEDRDVALTLDPEAPVHLAGPIYGIWPAVGAVGAAVVLLVVLML